MKLNVLIAAETFSHVLQQLSYFLKLSSVSISCIIAVK